MHSNKMSQSNRSADNLEPMGRFSVLSLNIRFGLADDGPNNWIHRKTTFPTLFKNHPADFIGLQEVNDFQSDYFKTILTEYNCIGERFPAPSFWQSNLIFYKKDWECAYQDLFYLSSTPAIPSRFEKSRWPRQCTMGVFKNNDFKLTLTNTHFDFDTSVQIKSAELIKRRLSELSASKPAILMGDFNAKPDSPCHKIFTMQHKEDDKKEGPFFKTAFKEPYPGTFHGFKKNTTGDHIDWILYRGRIALEESKVIRENINGKYPSDHFPIFAVFGWEKDER